MRLADREACSVRKKGLAPEARRFAQGVAWAVALSAPFWALLAAAIVIWL